MNIYKISQDERFSCDTYDSAIVCAENEDDARKIHPASNDIIVDNNGIFIALDNSNIWGIDLDSWCSNIKFVKVELIGIAKEDIKRGLILASFNAG